MATFQIEIPDEEYANLEAMAREEYRSPKQQAEYIVKEVVEAWMEEHSDERYVDAHYNPGPVTHLKDSTAQNSIACDANVLVASTSAPGCVSCRKCLAIHKEREADMLRLARQTSLREV